MPFIFSGHRSQQVRPLVSMPLLESRHVRGVLYVDDWPGSMVMRSIMTNFVIQERTNVQVSHMVGGNVFLTSFGDRIGELTVTGLCFSDTCFGGPAIGDFGMVRVIRYYRRNRFTVRQRPILVGIGTQAYFSFLIGMRGAMADVERELYQFTYQFLTLPL